MTIKELISYASQMFDINQGVTLEDMLTEVTKKIAKIREEEKK